MLSHLTPKQKEVLDFIVSFINEKGIRRRFARSRPASISLRHPQFMCISGPCVNADISVRRPRDPAHVSLSRPTRPSGGRSALLPLAGLITAGQPIEAIEERETFAVPVELAPDSANSYVLRVKGDSMIEDGYLTVICGR